MSESQAPLVVRPHAGEQITILIEVNGVPVTHVVSAGHVSETTLMIPRGVGDQRWAIEPQGRATVLFVRDGRWYTWPMRVEEALPSSYFLVSEADPGEGERRQFVRSQVALRVSIGRPGDTRSPWREVVADLSSAGIRLAMAPGLAAGDLVTVSIRAEGHAHAVSALARVVRILPESAEEELVALEFEQLGSSDEDRLAQIVYRSRESALYERIGRREFS